MIDESKYKYIGKWNEDYFIDLPTLEYKSRTGSWYELIYVEKRQTVFENKLKLDKETEMYLRMKYL